ncbi:MAG: hypothetical protein IJ955_05455 [Oscillospiraceae bacterium]|nr:hypothetical protein [Oscillospiraceae bacterium]
MARNYAALPHEYLEEMALLTDEEFGQLCRALLRYSREEEVVEPDSAARLFLPRVKMQEDRYQASYEEVVEKRREAGRKGGLARNKAAVERAEDAHRDISSAKQKEADASKTKQSQASASKPNQTETKIKTDTKTKPLPPSEEGGEKRTRFTPPTLEQVREYVAQRGSRVDPQGFLDFYASKGWMIGKTPMKDWKAACRNSEAWERWGRKPVGSQPPLSATSAAVYADAHERNLRFLEELRRQ